MVAEWNPGSVKPTKPDVYERDYTWNGNVETMYCKWDGKQWYVGQDTVSLAHCAFNEAPDQTLPWREIQPETTSLRVSDANA